MPNSIWKNTEQRNREWLFAKKVLMPDGVIQPNGTKLRRKDYPEVQHSFMVMNGRIIALAGKTAGNPTHLGKGRYGHTKLAEDEAGKVYALKIIHQKEKDVNSPAREAVITMNLGIGEYRIERQSKRFPSKNYILNKFLGNSIDTYLRNNPLTLDKGLELCIKISSALAKLHGGENTCKLSYAHGDIHAGNVLIDDQEEVHFIDFGRTQDISYPTEQSAIHQRDDIIKLLELFYWILVDLVGDYQIYYYYPSEMLKNNLYLYVTPSKENPRGPFSEIHYVICNHHYKIHTGKVDISDLGLSQLPFIRVHSDGKESPWSYSLNGDDEIKVKNKILEVAVQTGQIVSPYLPLSNLLKKFKDLLYTRKCPTALEIAGVLTECRQQLNQSQPSRLEPLQSTALSGVPEPVGTEQQLVANPVQEQLPKATVLALEPASQPSMAIAEVVQDVTIHDKGQLSQPAAVNPDCVKHDPHNHCSNTYQSTSVQELPKPLIKQAELHFLREFKGLEVILNEEQQKIFIDSKQQKSRKEAFEAAAKLVQEIQKQFPLTEDRERVLNPSDDPLLNTLAEICSHTRQGLHFLANNGTAFSCDVYYADYCSGTIKREIYDLNTHQNHMERLSILATTLEGYGLKTLRNVLVAMAGLMLVAAGILLATATGGLALPIALGAAALLSAGAGFFAGRDTGLAKALSNVPGPLSM